MGMSQSYGARDDAESTATIRRALELGVNFFDTADVYGPHHNETLLGRALGRDRERVVVATKGGLVPNPEPGGRRVDGRPEYLQKAVRESLRRLGTDRIDLYYLHRVDPTVPIESSVGALARFVETGEIGHLGLSEVSPATLRRAHAVHPITAVQSEYSLWTRDPEGGLLAACEELGVGFVPFAPLGRGFLAGSAPPPAALGDGDFRRGNPRFEPDNYEKNRRWLAPLEPIARDRGATPAQIALAWLLARAPWIVPIPGTKRRRYLEENVGAAGLVLRETDLAAIDRALPPDQVAGDRYPPALKALVGQ